MINPIIDRYLKGNPIILFDVGAKGGTFELRNLTKYIKCFAFEPNPYEFARLVNGRVEHLRHAEKQNFQIALSDKIGQAELFITNKPSYTSLLEVDPALLRKHLELMPRYDEWQHDFKILEKVIVPTTTLTEFCKSHNLTKIDFLKLDTQGNELDILSGGRELLKNISAIKCEVSFMPVYKRQYLFSEIDSFLRKHGFEFVDCIFYPHQISDNTWGSKKRKIFDKPRYSTGGDAIYIKDIENLNSDDSLFKLGVIMAELGYLSESNFCLSRHPSISDKDIDIVFKNLSKKGPLKKLKKLLRDWMPPKLISILSKAIYNK